ncbi:PHP domain-containing protein [Salarchaeum sp. JOR-1]|uniref:PHP domain-containing protein n=1 Tax=Salarchaeum sp. JOR-1 TaxID=2599399 RepID=UPI001198749E|nr:PHP domain-containing protein [Salarchaeum sp. JOR-1]QDX40155.1 PHP domain-containing protein [Salarchaeum sp. JOR-1]
MVYADLHVHTTRSDGTFEPDEVAPAAAGAGLDAVAITDHDRVQPDLPPVTTRAGVELVHGIELRVETPDEQIDLLGYGVTPTDALTDELDRLQRDRETRGRRIIENVEDHLGIDLGVEAREGIGRPHIARAVVDHPDTDYDDVSGVFDALIGDDGPCYVARDVTGFDEGVRLLHESCGVVGLAHPLRYDDPDAALARARDLDAVELHYPYDRPVGQDPTDAGFDRVRETIDEHDLLATGGTDAHDTELAKAGVNEAEYDRLRDRL